MKVKLRDREYELHYTIRGLFIFEQITNRPFEVKTLLDNYVLIYSFLLACNGGDDIISFEDFLDELDNNPKLFSELNEMTNEKK